MRGPPQDGSFACFASQVAALSGEEEGGAQSALDGGRTLLPLCRSSCIPRHEVSGGGRRGDRPRSSGRPPSSWVLSHLRGFDRDPE